MINVYKILQNLDAIFEFLDRMYAHKREKALRVLRAVNIGWRFTARMQVVRRERFFCDTEKVTRKPFSAEE